MCQLICIFIYFFKIDDDEVTRPTFAERKRLGNELFDSDSNSSTSEPSVHSSSEEDEDDDEDEEKELSSNETSSSNEDSSNRFVWQNKLKILCESMTMEDFDRIR